MVSLSTGGSIPGGLRFGKEPGVPVCDPVSSALAHETVAHDDREYTSPLPSWQGNRDQRLKAPLHTNPSTFQDDSDTLQIHTSPYLQISIIVP